MSAPIFDGPSFDGGPAEPVVTPFELGQLFDSQQSVQAITFAGVAIGVGICISIFLFLIRRITEKYKLPGWKIWTLQTRQKVAIIYANSKIAILVEAILLVANLYSVGVFVYLTIRVSNLAPIGTPTRTIFALRWIYWSEFVISILSTAYVVFNLYACQNSLKKLFTLKIICAVLASTAAFFGPFRGSFNWYFQYLRIIGFATAFETFYPIAFSNYSTRLFKSFSYWLTTLCLLFATAGFFFVIENKYLNESARIANLVDAIYYVVITVSTTGYGDITPQSVLGRIAAVLLGITAIIYIPIRVLKLSKTLQRLWNSSIKRPGGHVIVYASNISDFQTFVDQFLHPHREDTSASVFHTLITGIDRRKLKKEVQLCLVTPDSSIGPGLKNLILNSKKQYRIQALNANLNLKESRKRCYLNPGPQMASAIFFMADKRLGSFGDSSSLVTAMSLVQSNPHLPIYLQVQSRSSKATAVARGLTRTLCIEELRLGILIQNIIHPGFCPLILNLMKSTILDTDKFPNQSWLKEYTISQGHEIYSSTSLEHFVDLPFAVAALYIYKTYGQILIGISTSKSRQTSIQNVINRVSVDSRLSFSSDNSSTSERQPHDTRFAEETRFAGETEEEHHKRVSRMTFDGRRMNIGEELKRQYRAKSRHSIRKTSKRQQEFDIPDVLAEPPPQNDFNRNSDDPDSIKFDDWRVKINPGHDKLIKRGDCAILISPNQMSSNAVEVNDVKLIQALSKKVQRWEEVRAHETASTVYTLSELGDDDEEEEEGEDQEHLEGPPMILDLNRTGMTRLNPTNARLVPIEVKRDFVLIRSGLNTLKDAFVDSVEELVKNHVVICGNWLEDLYDIVSSLRSRKLPGTTKIIPIVFLSDQAPSSLLWDRIAIFPKVYYIKGSQCSAKDLTRAGVITAKTVLVLSPKQTGDDEASTDSKSILTFLILQKLTSAHTTVELVSTGSTSLLLKSDPILSTEPPIFETKEQREEYKAKVKKAKEEFELLSTAGPFANPYFASGNVFVTSFLDSLICLAFFNDQILSVLSSLTNPDVLVSVTAKDLFSAYPYLTELHKKPKVPPNGAHHNQNTNSNTHTGTAKKTKRRKHVPFYKVFLHFMKYDNYVLLAVVRNGFGSKGNYVITAPPPDSPVQPNDIFFLINTRHNPKPQVKNPEYPLSFTSMATMFPQTMTSIYPPRS